MPSFIGILPESNGMHTLAVKGLDFGVLVPLWSQNDVTASCLILTATSNCFPKSIVNICKLFQHIAMLSTGKQ